MNDLGSLEAWIDQRRDMPEIKQLEGVIAIAAECYRKRFGQPPDCQMTIHFELGTKDASHIVKRVIPLPSRQ